MEDEMDCRGDDSESRLECRQEGEWRWFCRVPKVEWTGLMTVVKGAAGAVCSPAVFAREFLPSGLKGWNRDRSGETLERLQGAKLRNNQLWTTYRIVNYRVNETWNNRLVR